MSINDLLNSSMPPHGHCYLWNDQLVYLHVTSDALIFLAYFSIPAALVYLVRKRTDLAFNYVFFLFALFILACGFTHLMAVYNVWHGAYWLSGVLKAVTALASVGTAITIWALIPKALALPSVDHFRGLNLQLEHEVEEKQRAVERAENLSRVKSTFLANMSHELRTPLNAILGFSDLLLLNDEVPPSVHEDISRINRSGRHLLALINDVLDISKIEAGKTTLNETTFDSHKLFNEITQVLSLQCDNKRVALRLGNIEELPSFLQADELKLKQILLNLLSNAYKFTDAGGTIEMSALFDGEFLSVTVADSGCGISDEEIDTIFDAFGQTESSRASLQGTGLGLGIGKHLAQLMGGDLTVSSELGKGSIFHLSILAQTAEATASSDHNRHVTGLAEGQPSFRILVVDDVELNRLALTRLLSQIGFSTKVACDGREAVDAAESWRPQLIFMDQHLPSMAGDEATRIIKQRHPDIIVIAHSASVLDKDQQRILAAGGSGFVNKPYRVEEILDTLIAHLDVCFCYTGELDNAEDSAVSNRPSVQEKSIPGSGRVLVVEDNPTNRILIERQLQQLSLTVVMACDGREALELWRQQRFDLVLTDCEMPVMDGCALARTIREAECDSDQRTTIIAYTAGPEEKRAACEAAGMDGVLGKPIDLEALQGLLTKSNFQTQ